MVRTLLQEEFQKGDLLGEIKNLKGDIIEKFIAPHDGIMSLIMYNPVKLPGDLSYKLLK